MTIRIKNFRDESSHIAAAYARAFVGASLIAILFFSVFAAIDRYDAQARARIAEVARLDAERLKAELERRKFEEWLYRDVVETFVIKQAEWDGTRLKIWGHLTKRDCKLNPPDDPYAAVTFYVEEEGGVRYPVANYNFGHDDDDRIITRPAGSSAIKGWEIYPGGQYDENAVIVPVASHLCGLYMGKPVAITSRPFARFKISDVISR